jgi:3-(methylthio)propanoyl-CoA dehydrogenase
VAYQPPLADIAFALRQHADLDDLSSWFGGGGVVDTKTTLDVLDEAARFVADVFVPLGRIGDEVPARRNDDGTVSTAPGTPAAYAKFIESGWAGISFDEEYGGGGQPWTTTIAVQEMITSASMGLSLCPLLTQGAIEMLLHHGSDELKNTYLPKMITSEWTGTMNLTEPDAGSDVGALRSKAVKADDGTYRISGTKIYITFGEHDLAENIIHLVLARTPGAPPGTKGISVFVVPKFLVNADGSLGERNSLECLKVEHKVGIHASPTCVMEFDNAVGYLIGDECTGMRSMFTMMNNARLSVGLEGLSVTEASYQQALAYARDRKQGRAVGAEPGSSPIIDHADVRLMLATMKAYIEAMRALLYFDAAHVDKMNSHPDADERAAARDLVALLTPICKGWSTDLGVELTSLGIQIHGGMGFVEETGAAQHWRDSRIAPIYEGTNGIQAIDLVTRKLPLGGGAVLENLLARVEADAGETPALAAVRRATASLHIALGEGRLNDALGGSTAYLRMVGTVLGDWFLQRAATAARQMIVNGTGDATYLNERIAIANFYRLRLLPTAVGLESAATAGSADLFALSFR